MALGTRLFTWWKGELVGSDQLGNRYYIEKGAGPRIRGGGRASRERRWVIYDGEAEASRVPPEWHAWLHHSVDALPRPGQWPHYPWQKEHLPNLSGTPLAYRPPGSLMRGGHRAPASGDYEPWTPN